MADESLMNVLCKNKDSDVIKRVEVERDNLLNKISKLMKFMCNEEFYMLSTRQCELLTRQLQNMTKYLCTLVLRLEEIGIE